MKREQRHKLIKDLVDKGELNTLELIDEVAKKSKVPKTVIKEDIEELYSTPKAAKETPATTSKRVKVKPEGATAEIRKGRLTEYEVPHNELNSVHVELEKVIFDPLAGLKKSSPFVQKFDKRGWDNFRKNAAGAGFNYVRVLYAPEGVNKEVVDPRQPKK